MKNNNTSMSPVRLMWTCLSAFGVAIVILVLFVLPAEFAIDPTGSGKLLGLTDLSGLQSEQIVHQAEKYNTDRAEFILSPFESLEYKYRIEENGILLYSWQASGELLYDFHAEPDGAEPGFAESFDKQRKDSSKGSYTASFPGIHGWYWENRGSSDVRINLISSGYYSRAIEFRDGLISEKVFTSKHPNTGIRESDGLVE